MKEMDKTGFLFDLDGVLIDSEREYTRIWNEIDRKYPSGVEEFALKIKGQTLTKILEENYPEQLRGDVDDMLHRLEERMEYSYCPGAREFLYLLRKRGENTAVVTSSDGEKMNHLYCSLPEFKEGIDRVIDASRVKRSKPDPEGYILAAEELGVPISRCAVFEDSVQGVKAGRASGAYVVGITGTKKREELAPFCDVVVDGLDEIEVDSLNEILKSR